MCTMCTPKLALSNGSNVLPKDDNNAFEFYEYFRPVVVDLVIIIRYMLPGGNQQPLRKVILWQTIILKSMLALTH